MVPPKKRAPAAIAVAMKVDLKIIVLVSSGLVVGAMSDGAPI